MDITPAKKQFLEAALQKGKTRILVVTGVQGVDLPAHLMGQITIPLDLVRSGRRPRIWMLNDKIQTDLSFGGRWLTVVVPWLAIGMIVDCEGNFQAYNARELNEAAMKSTGGVTEVPVPHALEGIEGGGELTPPRTGHLKLVA